jgi:LmbE family N-acetylglucosaminyl deacetylase
MPDKLTILVLGAHPDDAELHMGGTLSRYRRLGHHVKIVSATNGAAGHHQLSGPVLIERRRRELAASTAIIGAESEVWEFPDGALLPSLELREQIITEIRRLKPDLIFTHRPNDYHPDHRAVGIAVQDASYLVTVPPVVPAVPALRNDAVVVYMNDTFTKPYPFQPDVIVDVTTEIDTIIEMAHCHTSQVYEWLPYNRSVDDVPTSEDQRKVWLRSVIEARWTEWTNRFINELPPGRSDTISFLEAFEISEYAAPMNADTKRRLFPF